MEQKLTWVVLLNSPFYVTLCQAERMWGFQGGEIDAFSIEKRQKP